jgi:hypothetical protein
MAEETTILQSEILSNFVFPFLLVFFLVFAILEKTKIFGDGKKQINAFTAGVIALIFIGAVYPKIVVGKLTLFLAVALVIIFVTLLTLGFIFGDFSKIFESLPWLKLVLGVGSLIAVVGAVLWATGWHEFIIKFLSSGSTGSQFLGNVVLLIVVAVAVAVVLKKEKKS